MSEVFFEADSGLHRRDHLTCLVDVGAPRPLQLNGCQSISKWSHGSELQGYDDLPGHVDEAPLFPCAHSSKAFSEAHGFLKLWIDDKTARLIDVPPLAVFPSDLGGSQP